MELCQQLKRCGIFISAQWDLVLAYLRSCSCVSLPSSTIGLTSALVLLWVSDLHLPALVALSLTPLDPPSSRLALKVGALAI
jgi:hypothetical protein